MHTNSLATDMPQGPRGSRYFGIAFAAIACLFGLLSCLIGLMCLAEGMIFFFYTPDLVQAALLTSETQGHIATAVFLCIGLVFTYAGVKAFRRNFRVTTNMLPNAAFLLSTMPLVGFGLSNAFC